MDHGYGSGLWMVCVQRCPGYGSGPYILICGHMKPLPVPPVPPVPQARVLQTAATTHLPSTPCIAATFTDLLLELHTQLVQFHFHHFCRLPKPGKRLQGVLWSLLQVSLQALRTLTVSGPFFSPGLGAFKQPFFHGALKHTPLASNSKVRWHQGFPRPAFWNRIQRRRGPAHNALLS